MDQVSLLKLESTELEKFEKFSSQTLLNVVLLAVSIVRAVISSKGYSMH